MYMYVRVYLYRSTNSYFGLCVSSAGSDILASFFRSMLIRFTGSSRLAIPLFQDSGNYVSSPAGVGVRVVPGGRGWTPAFFAAPAGVGAWVVPGGRGWTPNFTDVGFLYSESCCSHASADIRPCPFGFEHYLGS